MHVTRLRINNVRNVRDSELLPSSTVNLIVGDNGSGKSSVLEAIHLLGVGRSFRTRRIESVVRHEATSLHVYGEVEGEIGRHRLGIGKGQGTEGTSIRIDGKRHAAASALAEILPIQAVSPESIELVIGGPQERRGFVDWGLFHVEHRFHRAWLDYRTGLKQRNAALRTRADPGPWDRALAENGDAITGLRRAYVAALAPLFANLLAALSANVALDLEYRQGWAKENSLLDALRAAATRDREAGFTNVGPHRADVRMRTPDGKGAECLSRGQQKAALYALKLAQASLMIERSGVKPVILVDDLPAELDEQRRQRVLDILEQLGAQVFISSVEQALLPVTPAAVFHVEQGVVSKVV